RGHLRGRPRRRRQRGPDQDGLDRPRRADRQVQPAPPDRGGAGQRGLLARALPVRPERPMDTRALGRRRLGIAALVLLAASLAGFGLRESIRVWQMRQELSALGRAVFKLLLDWRGMLTTWRFVDAAYRRLDTLPDEAALEHETAAPVFVHVVPAWEEPAIAATLRALLDSRYPHGKLHVVVVTKEAEEQAPHPLMEASTAELVRRFRAELPPWQQKQLSQLAMPGEGRKAHQLNWALRPELLRALLEGQADPARGGASRGSGGSWRGRRGSRA